MEADVLQWTEEVLKETEEFFLPLRKLWKMSQDEGYETQYEEFASLLRSDPRFEFHGRQPAEESLPPTDEAEMEQMGFYGGPLVGLKGREPTREQVRDILLKKMDKMLWALQKAYEVRPEGDEATEDDLIEAMARAKRLRQGIEEAFDQSQGAQSSGSSEEQTPQ